MHQTRLLHLMLMISLVAIYLAGLRHPTALWTEAATTTTVAVLLWGLSRCVSAATGPEARRWWCSFVAAGAANLVINGMRAEVAVGARLPTYWISILILRNFVTPTTSGDVRYQVFHIANAGTSLLVGWLAAIGVGLWARRGSRGPDRVG